MDRTERFHIIDQLLNQQRFVTKQQFLETLEVSLATFKRDIEYMRDRLGAPIVWQREINAYVYDREGDDQNFQLPGLWFNTAEIHALMTMDALLGNLQQGLLSQHIKPLRTRIKTLLVQGDYAGNEVAKRIKVLTVAAKTYKSEYFQALNQALFSRKRILIKHYNRRTDSITEREVSPQRLTFYRDNWYLDAWCHQKKALRSFAIDAMKNVVLSNRQAKEIENSYLDEQLASGYGIFSGSKVARALLKFTPLRARWVSKEQWHPNQKTYFDDQGFYYLEIPFSSPTELIMDILKYGADVEVIRPKSLRQKVVQSITQLAKIYA